jgi:DMSO reductase family type II enzyme heme b subunit
VGFCLTHHYCLCPIDSLAVAGDTGHVVTAVRLTAPSDRLLDPAAADWASAKEETVTLEPTPVDSQPSQYVINAWKERPYGLTGELRVAAAHNGEALFFRLSWQDDTEDVGIPDTDRFTDGAGVLFPVRSDATLLTMGTPDRPVNAWYWRADLDAPLSVTATGLGTTVRYTNSSVAAAASHGAGGWQVVISRPFSARGEEGVALMPGQTTMVGFAVWQGSNQERAGIKGVTLEWQPLEIEG